MADIAVDKAELVGLFVETLLYGIFVALFYQSIRILTWQRKGPEVNWLLLVTFLAVFMTATGHLAVILCRALDAFIEHRNSHGGPIAYYVDLRNRLELSQASFQVAISILGDGMAVYRVFVVYERQYLPIVLPAISLAGTVVASIGSVVVIGQASSLYLSTLETWLPLFFSLTVCTSIICTGMIAIRLWYINSRVTAGTTGTSQTRKLTAIQRILIESAILYSVSVFIYLVTYLMKTNYSIVFGDMVSPIIGIVFSLITIRVNDVFNAPGRVHLTQTGCSKQAFNSPKEIGPGLVSLKCETGHKVDSFSDGCRTAVEMNEV